MYLRKKGLKVLAQGYNVIPIAPNSKAPKGVSDFLTVPTTPKRLNGWLANGHANDGIGITTADTPMVDIDCSDEREARILHAYTFALAGKGMVRIGQPPKRGIVYRTDKPFSKMSSKVYIDPQGRRCQIEILGDGQQFVGFAIHPDTKKPYSWIGFPTPENTPHDSLPIFYAEHGRKIIEFFENRMAELGWPEAGHTTTQLPAVRLNTEADDLIDDSAPIGMDIEELRERMQTVANDGRFDERGEWFKIGAAIWHETEGSAGGKEIFHEWSAQHRSHNDALFEKLWNSLGKRDGQRSPITARYIKALSPEYTAKKSAKESAQFVSDFTNAQTTAELSVIALECQRIQFTGLDFALLMGALQDAFKRISRHTLPAATARRMLAPVVKEGEKPDWLDGWCFLEEIDRYFNINTKQFMTTRVFDAAFSRNLPEDSSLTASQYAMRTVRIPTYFNALYLPAEDETFKWNGRLCVNTYSEANIPEVPKQLTEQHRRHIEIFRAHFRHLFPDDREHGILLSWLAYIVQTRQRPNWAVVIQGVEGDGKSMIGEMMAGVLGGDNCRVLQAKTLEATHTAWAVGQLLTFIEEVRMVGHNRHDILNSIKPLITNSTIDVHPKNVNPYNAPNTTAYMAATNFANALPVDDNDRRYFILQSRWQTKEALDAFKTEHPSYYDNLAEALSVSAGALRGWLLALKPHSEFRPKGSAPASEGRAYMARLNKTDTALDLIEIIRDRSHADVSEKILVISSLNSALMDDNFDMVGAGAARVALSEAGFYYLGRFSIDGKRESVWTKMRNIWPKDPEKRAKAVRKCLFHIKKTDFDI